MHASLMPVPLCRTWNLSLIRLYPRLPPSQRRPLLMLMHASMRCAITPWYIYLPDLPMPQLDRRMLT